MTQGSEPSYKKWVALISLAIALFGVPLFFIKEYQSVERQRTNNTLELIDDFHRGEIFSKRLTVNSIWNAYDLEQAMRVGISTDVLNAMAKSIFKKNREKWPELISVTQFLDYLAICATVSECKKDMIVEFTGNDMACFYETYSGAISYLRTERGFSTLGNQLSDFLSSASLICNDQRGA